MSANTVVKNISMDFGCLQASVPMIEIGEEPHPRLCISCCVHGNETAGLFIVEAFIRSLAAFETRGSIALLPICNPFATLFGGRVAPTDYQDMNRIAPGNPGGTISERIVWRLMNLIWTADVYIDLHEFEINSMLEGIIFESPDPDVSRRSRQMLETFGPDVIFSLVAGDKYPRSWCGFSAAQKNTPCFAIEIPNAACLTPEHIDRIVRSLLRVCGRMGIIEHPAEAPCTSPETIVATKPHVAPMQGLFHPLVRVGETIGHDTVIGSLTQADLTTTVEIRAQPKQGIVLQIAPMSFVNVGSLLSIIGQAQTAPAN